MSGSGNVNTLVSETERAPPAPRHSAATPRTSSAMYFTPFYILIPSEKGTEARAMYWPL